MDIIFRNRERVHNFFSTDVPEKQLITSDFRLYYWKSSGMADLTFRPDIIIFLIYNSRQMQERRALLVYIWTETLPSLFFPFTLATTRISWSGRGGCFKHEWSKWRHQTEFSRKSGVVFSLKTLITHTYTQSSKAVSGGKKKHGGGFIWVGQLAFSVMHERETGANISRGQTKTHNWCCWQRRRFLTVEAVLINTDSQGASSHWPVNSVRLVVNDF